MSDSTPDTESPTDRAPLLSGPFHCYHVVVHGKVVPGLEGWPTEDGQIGLSIGNAGETFEPEVARRVAYLVAQALAVGAGYADLHASTKDHPFMRRTPLPEGLRQEHWDHHEAIRTKVKS